MLVKRGNANELGDVGKSSGKSFLFFVRSAPRPIQQLNISDGATTRTSQHDAEESIRLNSMRRQSECDFYTSKIIDPTDHLHTVLDKLCLELSHHDAIHSSNTNLHCKLEGRSSALLPTEPTDDDGVQGLTESLIVPDQSATEPTSLAKLRDLYSIVRSLLCQLEDVRVVQRSFVETINRSLTANVSVMQSFSASQQLAEETQESERLSRRLHFGRVDIASIAEAADVSHSSSGSSGTADAHRLSSKAQQTSQLEHKCAEEELLGTVLDKSILDSTIAVLQQNCPPSPNLSISVDQAFQGLRTTQMNRSQPALSSTFCNSTRFRSTLHNLDLSATASEFDNSGAGNVTLVEWENRRVFNRLSRAMVKLGAAIEECSDVFSTDLCGIQPNTCEDLHSCNRDVSEAATSADISHQSDVDAAAYSPTTAEHNSLRSVGAELMQSAGRTVSASQTIKVTDASRSSSGMPPISEEEPVNASEQFNDMLSRFVHILARAQMLAISFGAPTSGYGADELECSQQTEPPVAASSRDSLNSQLLSWSNRAKSWFSSFSEYLTSGVVNQNVSSALDILDEEFMVIFSMSEKLQTYRQGQAWECVEKLQEAHASVFEVFDAMRSNADNKDGELLTLQERCNILASEVADSVPASEHITLQKELCDIRYTQSQLKQRVEQSVPILNYEKLQDDYRHLQVEYSNSNQELSELQQKLLGTASALQRSVPKKQFEVVEGKLRSVKSECSQLLACSSVAEAKLINVQTDNEKLFEALAVEKERTTTAETDLSGVRLQLVVAQNELQQAAANTNHLMEMLDHYEADSCSLREEQSSLHDRLACTESLLATSKSEGATVQENLLQSQKENSALFEKLTESQSHLESLQAEVDRLRSELTVTEARLTSLQSENTNANHLVAEKEAQLSAITKSNCQLSTCLEGLQRDQADLEQQSEELKATISKHAVEVAELTADRTENAAACEKLRAEYESKLTIFTESHQSELSARVKGFEKTIADLESYYKNLLSIVKQKQVAAETLAHSLSEREEELMATISAKEAIISSLEERLSCLQAKATEDDVAGDLDTSLVRLSDAGKSVVFGEQTIPQSQPSLPAERVLMESKHTSKVLNAAAATSSDESARQRYGELKCIAFSLKEKLVKRTSRLESTLQEVKRLRKVIKDDEDRAQNILVQLERLREQVILKNQIIRGLEALVARYNPISAPAYVTHMATDDGVTQSPHRSVLHQLAVREQKREFSINSPIADGLRSMQSPRIIHAMDNIENIPPASSVLHSQDHLRALTANPMSTLITSLSQHTSGLLEHSLSSVAFPPSTVVSSNSKRPLTSSFRDAFHNAVEEHCDDNLSDLVTGISLTSQQLKEKLDHSSVDTYSLHQVMDSSEVAAEKDISETTSKLQDLELLQSDVRTYVVKLDALCHELADRLHMSSLLRDSPLGSSNRRIQKVVKIIEQCAADVSSTDIQMDEAVLLTVSGRLHRVAATLRSMSNSLTDNNADKSSKSCTTRKANSCCRRYQKLARDIDSITADLSETTHVLSCARSNLEKSVNLVHFT